MIGIAAKKRSVASGWDACESALRALKKRTVAEGGRTPSEYADQLLILAGDSAENTKDRFIKLSNEAGAGCIVFGSRSELGRRIGRGERSVLMITDKDITRGICMLLGFAADKNGGV